VNWTIMYHVVLVAVLVSCVLYIATVLVRR